MAIRFRPDDNDDNNNGGGAQHHNSSNNNRRGGGRNSNVIAAILMLVFRYPKIGIPLLLVGAILYFVMGAGSNNDLPSSSNKQEDLFSLGCNIDQEKYDKTLVYPSLDASSSKYGLPTKVSLRAHAPKRRDQGQQGSCVGWASAYAARTILESVATGKDPDNITYSPSFLYNQIGISSCQGAYTGQALEHMTKKGLLAFSKFPYDPSSCSQKPNKSQLNEALKHRIRGYNRLTTSGRNYDVDLEAVKQNIAQGAPVIIAMKVPYSFQDMIGKSVWNPTAKERRSVSKHGGHAMCLIGYDDDKQQFEIMNSWGEDWGERGFVWVSYQDFKQFCREAYGLFPHGKAQTATADKFALSVGLYNTKSKRNIPIRRVSGNLFQTSSKLSKNTGFKLEITNSLECYAYVFSKETAANGGNAITVFPPNKKWSTFLGIVGTRLFPKGGELYPDADGNQDFMAVVFSKKELNPDQLRQQIDAANRGSFYKDVMAAVGKQVIPNLNFANEAGLASFEEPTKGDKAIAVVVIAVDK